MTAPAKVREADIARAIRGVQRAGIVISRIEINTNGTIVIITGQPQGLGVVSEWPDDD